MMAGRRRFRVVLFLLVGLAASGLAFGASEVQVARGLELGSVGLRFAVRGEQKPPPNVVLVKIDDKTLDDLGVRWPFRRSVHARLIDRLSKDGAKVIAYDVEFRGRSSHPNDDDALVRAVDRAHDVVLSATATDGHGGTAVFGGLDLREIGARAGITLYAPDSNGVVRNLEYEVEGVKTFSIAVSEEFLGKKIAPARLGGETAPIDYVGPENTIPSVSFSDALRGKVPASFFHGKIVVVGSTLPTEQDVHATPTTPTMPGAEIQANAIGTALAGFPLRSAPWWWNALLVLGLGMLPAIVAIRARPLPTLLCGIGGGLLFALGAQLSFDGGHIVSVLYPLTALVLSIGGALGGHYLVEAMERQRTRDIFSRFVPEQVVNQVLTKTDSHLRLGGARVTGTCMFTDLRDSTKFAESLPPEQVVEIVNRYLGEVTEAILGHGGTLTSYLGDGFMAIFGAPIEQDDHADRAVAAAREILEERLPRFNEWFRASGYGEGFRMGIGINTGVFLAGNVGSERRLEYTAMGDTINAASRLEGLTKGTGFSAFIAESTCDALVRPANDLVFAGEHEVRGREAKIKVWSLPTGRLAPAAETADAGLQAAPAPA